MLSDEFHLTVHLYVTEKIKNRNIVLLLVFLISFFRYSIYVITFRINIENDRFKDFVYSDLHECLFFLLNICLIHRYSYGLIYWASIKYFMPAHFRFLARSSELHTIYFILCIVIMRLYWVYLFTACESL